VAGAREENGEKEEGRKERMHDGLSYPESLSSVKVFLRDESRMCLLSLSAPSISPSLSLPLRSLSIR
jgi:hypothetical protein